MASKLELRRRRLALKCRSRGSLEGDLLFARVIPKVAGFSASQLDQLEQLLDMEDPQLVRLISDESHKGSEVFELLRRKP